MSERAEFFFKGQGQLAEPYHYRASGLDDIYLLNGVVIEETPYGPMVTIKNLNGLHHAIGLHIVEKAEPMTGAEFRFLRKQLGLTQAQLGKRLRVSDQTIANYEKGHTGLGPADPLMRGFYLLSKLVILAWGCLYRSDRTLLSGRF
jgi:DNA-binding transcriptional regulator YiaG